MKQISQIIDPRELHFIEVINFDHILLFKHLNAIILIDCIFAKIFLGWSEKSHVGKILLIYATLLIN